MKMLLTNYSASGLADGVANWSEALLQTGMVDEAHFCLLLLQASPAWSIPAGSPGSVVSDALRSKMLLVGGANKKKSCRKACMSLRALFLSDALEYSKQRFNDKFVRGALVPFKLAHALLYQELGLLEKAAGYGDFVAKLLTAGGHKCKVDKLTSSALPTSLTHLTELVRYGLRQHKSAVLSVNKASFVGGASGSGGGGGGILGWFGFGAKKEDMSIASTSLPSPSSSSAQQKPPTAADQHARAATATTTSAAGATTTSSSAPPLAPSAAKLQHQQQPAITATISSAAAPAPAPASAAHARAQSAPAPTEQRSGSESSQARSPSIAARMGGAIGGAVVGTISKLGGIFGRGKSEGGKPPPPKAHLDSKPVPKWDEARGCYDIEKTDEQLRIEALTKAGPPKINRAAPVAADAMHGGGEPAQQQQQLPASNAAPRTGMGGKLPVAGGGMPPPPRPSQFSAVGRSRYVDNFN